MYVGNGSVWGLSHSVFRLCWRQRQPAYFPSPSSTLSYKEIFTLLLLATNGMIPHLQLQTEVRVPLWSLLGAVFTQVLYAPPFSSKTPGCLLNIQTPELLPNLLNYDLGASQDILELPERFLNSLNCENLSLPFPCNFFSFNESSHIAKQRGRNTLGIRVRTTGVSRGEWVWNRLPPSTLGLSLGP